MLYKKTCEKCEIEFSFNKTDIKKKNIIESEYNISDSCATRSYLAQEDYIINKGTAHKTWILEQDFNRMKVTYKYLKCPICLFHILILKVKSEFIEKYTKKEKRKHY